MSLRSRIRAGKAPVFIEGNSKIKFRLNASGHLFGPVFKLQREATDYVKEKFGVVAKKLAA